MPVELHFPFLCFFTIVNSGSWRPIIDVISSLMDTLVRCSAYGALSRSTLLRQRNSKACILPSISAERVHASHPYRAVDMTMALRSLIFVLIEIDLLLSRLSRGCNFAIADVAMASLDFIPVSDLPSFVI